MGSYTRLISGSMGHGFTLLTGSPSLRMIIGVRQAFRETQESKRKNVTTSSFCLCRAPQAIV